MRRNFNQSGLIHTLPLLIIVAAVGLISYLLISSAAPFNGGLFKDLNPKQSSNAQVMMMDQCFFMNGATPAFCDTFDVKHPVTRVGNLDPMKWTVFRWNSTRNTTQGDMIIPFNQVAQAQFCTQLKAMKADEDSFICGAEFGEPNHWMTTMDDGGQYQFMGARVLQPFDFTNRTGTFVFDVDAKTVGSHSWWPEVWLTAEPDAIPHHGQVAGNGSTPKFGVGFQFGSDLCLPHPNPGGAGDVTGGAGQTPTDTRVAIGGMDAIPVVTNYKEYPSQVAIGDGCYVVQSDHANHFEVRISTTRIEVWGSDKTDMHGTTGPNFKLLHVVTTMVDPNKPYIQDPNFPNDPTKQVLNYIPLKLPFSRGYLSFQQSHYNAGKEGVDSSQTYHWHGIGFDGPVISPQRDYAVPDYLGTHPGSDAIGYGMRIDGFQGYPKQWTFTLNNVDKTNAKDAWLSFAIGGDGADFPMGVWYGLNGKALQLAMDPNPNTVHGNDGSALLIPIPLSDLNQGTNTLTLKAKLTDPKGNGGMGIGNIDLVVNPVDNAPTPTPTLAPTPTPSPSSCSKVGDINCDGVVNVFDYNIEVTNFGKACTTSTGDLDGNSTCNIFDYNILVGNFGK